MTSARLAKKLAQAGGFTHHFLRRDFYSAERTINQLLADQDAETVREEEAARSAVGAMGEHWEHGELVADGSVLGCYRDADVSRETATELRTFRDFFPAIKKRAEVIADGELRAWVDSGFVYPQNKEQRIQLLRDSVEHWNLWRKVAGDVIVDLENANLTRAVLRGANLSAANLRQTIFIKADLTDAILDAADLTFADLWEAVGLPSAIQKHHIQQLKSDWRGPATIVDRYVTQLIASWKDPLVSQTQ